MPNILSSRDVLQALLTDLNAKAAELGMVLTAWDETAQPLPANGEVSEFCRIVQDCKAARQGCAKARRELAQVVVETNQSSRATSPWGCRLLGIPVRDRHRLIGAVVVEFPTLEMLDEEHFARLCDRLELDRQVLRGYAHQACRYAADEASHVQDMFTMFLQDQLRNQDANQALTSLSMNLAGTYEELSLLYHVSSSMKVSQEPTAFLQDVCDELREVISVEVVLAVVHDTRTRMDQDILVKAGSDDIDTRQLRLLAASYVLPQFQDASSLVLNNIFHSSGSPFLSQSVRSLIAVPLTVEREIIGLVMGLNKSGEFDSYDAKLISSIAGQSSVFLANHRMYAELQELLVGVLQSLTESIDAKDPYTCGHSRRVAEISRRMAEAIGLEPQRVQQIYLAGLLHDVGKIGVPEAILCKTGKLTDKEYKIIQQHPSIGAKILRRIRNLEPIISGVISHHERMDGRGYPNGLSGENVPLEGRILGLADSWDAMTSQRTYRQAMSLQKAEEEIRRCAGTQFDPKLVDLFLSWNLPTLMKDLNALNVHDLHFLNERFF
ncbi:MAG: HD domain-containing protein [Phycisphaerae bacterium]|nr:HD domain-containing protein [Phycisphaerae bacterium]